MFIIGSLISYLLVLINKGLLFYTINKYMIKMVLFICTNKLNIAAKIIAQLWV